MTGRPSTVLRVIRALTALVTVWCTGCAGFEPLADAAFGRQGAAMTCASADSSGMAMNGPAAAALHPSGPSVSVPSSVAAEKGFSCGCSSCHAVTLAAWSVPMPKPPTLAPLVQPAAALVSVGRAPLLPPPERTV
jgi:hypothetical protein